MDDNIRIESEFGRARPVPPPERAADVEVLSRAGRDWGLASLALGAVFAVMVFPGLQLARELELTGFAHFSRSDRRLAALAGYVGVALILLLAAAAIVFGVIGMAAAGRRRQPVALGLAGVLLNALNLFMWAGVGLAWAMAN